MTDTAPARMTTEPDARPDRLGYHELSWFDARRSKAVTIRVTTITDARKVARERSKRVNGGIEIWAVYVHPATRQPVRSAFVETVQA